jgi:hypothetical protein
MHRCLQQEFGLPPGAGVREVLDAPRIDFAESHPAATTLMTTVRRTLR